jgi:hypothetical protein
METEKKIKNKTENCKNSKSISSNISLHNFLLLSYGKMYENEE